MQLTHFQRLKIVRENHNLKQEEVADALGMTRPGYSLIERGKTKLSPLHLKKLKDKFNFDVDYIVNGSEHDEKLIVPELKKEQIARRLKMLRESRGESMPVVSKATGLSANLLYYYERGQLQPGLPKVKILAQYFGVPIEYILHGKVAETKIHEQETQKPPVEVGSFREMLDNLKDEILTEIKKIKYDMAMLKADFIEGNLSPDNVFPFHPNRQTEKNVIGWY